MSGGSSSNPVNKALGGVGSFLSHPLGGSGSFLNNPGQIWDVFKPNIPGAPPPPPSPPDSGSVRAQGQANQLQNEQKLAGYQTQPNAQGLLDEPTTASRVLLGA